MESKRAVRQLKAIEKMAGKIRLAADDWDEDWKTLIATIMSARTTDKITIPIAERLFNRYRTIGKLAKANVNDIAIIIRPVNFYKTKARNVVNCAQMLVDKHNSKVPHDFSKLIELPGVGRKTANVFLAEQGHGRIGIDTHVNFISHYLEWTDGKNQEDVEKDLEKLFPEKYWGDINWILVRFGQTFRSRKEKREILKKIRKLK